MEFIPLKMQLSDLEPALECVLPCQCSMVTTSSSQAPHQRRDCNTCATAPLLQDLLPLLLNSASMVQETLDVFVPLANRLGVWTVKSQLEDLAFQILQVSLLLSCASVFLSNCMLHGTNRQRCPCIQATEAVGCSLRLMAAQQG